MRISLLLVVLFLFACQLFGQDRFMVFFNDKANSPYRIEAPQEFLSERALQRRIKEGLRIDETDLPVSPVYLQQLKDLGVEMYFTTKWMNGVIVQMEQAQRAGIEALSFVEAVEYVGPGTLLSNNEQAERRRTAISTQEQVNSPTVLQHTMIGADLMHQRGVEGEGVLIAVFDDGFANYTQIPAFQSLIEDNRIVYEKDFTTNTDNVEHAGTHGTRVLSVLAADDGNYKGMVPKASYVLSITEASGEYRVEEYNWLFAAERADSAGVDIINASLGYSIFDDPTMSYTTSDMDGQTTVVSRAAQLAADKGILVVNSAGNTGASTWQTVVAPADVPDVLSIGAVDRSGQRSFFSAIGPNAQGELKPDVVALGSGTAVIDWDGQYRFQNGTSFSAPLIAGLAGGLLSAYPTLTKELLFELMLRSASQYDDPNDQIGHGIPHYELADQLINLQLIIAPIDFTLFPNPATNGIVRIALGEGFVNELLSLNIINQNGQKLMEETISNGNGLVTLDLRGLQSGIYLVRLKSRNGIRTKKLLIQ